MLNPFPTMWLSLLAFFILRVTIGGTLLFLGLRHLQHQPELMIGLRSFIRSLPAGSAQILALLEIGVGALIIAGYHTQYACLVGIGVSIFFIIFRGGFTTELLPPRIYYLLLFGALISLFITGAGAFAFDLPL